MLALASLLSLGLCSPPIVHAGPEGILSAGPSLRATANAGADVLVRNALHAHPDTEFRGKFYPRKRVAGGVWIVREYLHGIPVAGARVALRSDTQDRLRQIVGQQVDADVALPRAPRSTPAHAIWWPTDAGLVLAQQIDDELSLEHGQAHQDRRVVELSSGRELARWSLIDHSPVSMRGWPENPLTTPTTELYEIELFDQEPLLLENAFMRVVDCNWDAVEESCATVFFPQSSAAQAFVDEPPPLGDAAAHRDANDAFAAVQNMQWMMRTQARLLSWGWDPMVWDEIDCSWQEVPNEQCQLWVRANVLKQDEDGVFPFSGAFYSTASGVYMGQGDNADTSFDGDIVVHELGHHITRGYGVPEPTSIVRDRSRRFADRQAINEATSDLLARQMFDNDRIYDYFSAVEPGSYVEHKIRHVGTAFRCPENIVGEVHMDGRIWVSALRAAQVELDTTGLLTPDEFMETFLVAHAALRQIPTLEVEQFPPATDIVIDEFRMAHGNQAAAVLESIFNARGLSRCDRTLDISQEPSVRGDGDPNDPLDARFIVLSSYASGTLPLKIEENPYAPPVHHRVRLVGDETGVSLRYRPGIWRPAHLDDPVPPLRLGLLLSPGDQGIAFWWDTEVQGVANDAQQRFISSEVGVDGWAEVRAEGLVPGTNYAIALVALTENPNATFVLEDMQWSILSDETGGETGSESGTETGAPETSGDTGGETGGDTGAGSSDAATSSDEGSESGRPNAGQGPVALGCTCTAKASDPDAPGGIAFALLCLVGVFRRRRTRA